MNYIKSFDSFSINEKAGYGNDYFVVKKQGKVYSYYFKAGEDEEETGIVVTIGKFSRGSVIGEAENSYGVIHMEKISHDDLDDILVNDIDRQEDDSVTFSLSDYILDESYDIIIKCLEDYLDKNPKVVKFYDEILENLEMEHEEYSGIVKNKLNEWSDGVWNVQDGASDKIIIYTKASYG
jgi:type I site-specific restriction-modification system R (restriction) subunit